MVTKKCCLAIRSQRVINASDLAQGCYHACNHFGSVRWGAVSHLLYIVHACPEQNYKDSGMWTWSLIRKCHVPFSPSDYKCEEPCGALLECGHPCPGTCSRWAGGRLHQPCSHPCNRNLACGHACKFSCLPSLWAWLQKLLQSQQVPTKV